VKKKGAGAVREIGKLMKDLERIEERIELAVGPEKKADEIAVKSNDRQAAQPGSPGQGLFRGGPLSEKIEKNPEKQKMENKYHAPDPAADRQAEGGAERGGYFPGGLGHLLEKPYHQVGGQQVGGRERDILVVVHGVTEYPWGDGHEYQGQATGAPPLDLLGAKAREEKKIKSEKRIHEMAELEKIKEMIGVKKAFAQETVKRVKKSTV